MLKSHINPDLIAQLYQGLHGIGALGSTPKHGPCPDGYHRAAYSDVETQAMQYVEQCAKHNGLRTQWDAAGNLIIETTHHVEEWIETGSHLDTVPGGGNFDGAAGVIAGLAALIYLSHQVHSNRGYRLRIWRGEESASFGITSIGARAALHAESVVFPSELQQAMLSQGISPDHIAQGHARISAPEMETVCGYIELHIEQGKVLEQAAKDIGIVTGICGSIRSWVHVSGTFDHSGATPMGIDYRQDSNLAMAYMQVALNEMLRDEAEHDFTQTIGVVRSHEQYSAVSKVCGACCFSHEIRGASPSRMQALSQKAFAIIRDTARQWNVNVEIETFACSDGVEALDTSIQRTAQKICDNLGYSHQHLVSGAWHDAAVYAHAKRSDGSSIPTGMLFIPCIQGISHAPNEYAHDEHIANGATVLAQLLQHWQSDD